MIFNQLNSKGGQRSSNLELYRIICMLLIVGHHYVVNSGLTGVGSPLFEHPCSKNSLFLYVFGMWGKTGINCFLMITGYFQVCKSNITLRKFLKLIFEVYFYNIVIFIVFLLFGFETLSLSKIFRVLIPINGLSNNFVGCFLCFWVTIPFWNILVHNMTKKQHLLLIAFLLGLYTLLGSIPPFKITFNYLTWFGVIYLVASYIRLYPSKILDKRSLWGWITILSIVLAIMSVLVLQIKAHKGLFFVSETNKLFSVIVAVSSFLWLKNVDIPHSRIINAIGGLTFGVLLIHANSNAMRTWLWKDIVDSVGHYSQPLGQLILYSFAVVFAVFMICIVIDRIRIILLEEPFFKWYDNRTINNIDNK